MTIQIKNTQYLEIFYNRQRRHVGRGHLSPEQFEMVMLWNKKYGVKYGYGFSEIT